MALRLSWFAICASWSESSCWSVLEFCINPGDGVVVLFVGFDGDEEACKMGGDITIVGLSDTVLLSFSAEGKAELSAGERSRSSVGSDRSDKSAGRSDSVSRDEGLACAR